MASWKPISVVGEDCHREEESNDDKVGELHLVCSSRML